MNPLHDKQYINWFVYRNKHTQTTQRLNTSRYLRNEYIYETISTNVKYLCQIALKIQIEGNCLLQVQIETRR